MLYKEGITIFTPTFNRKNLLEKLYKSLQKQTDKRFEWLIIDDGSTDNTCEIVNTWKLENKIEIKYVFQKNQGKSAAHNTALKNSNYELFFCVDSDDYLDENSVDTILKSKTQKEFDDCIGIIALKKNMKNTKNMKDINVKENLVSISELYCKYHYNDELAIIIKTNIAKKYPFPIIENEKFMPEAYLYDNLDAIGKMIFANKVIYYYEYQDTGYTNSSAKLITNNIKGYTLFAEQRMRISKQIMFKLKGAVQYNVSTFIRKKVDKQVYKNNLGILLITFPIAIAFYIKKYKLNK